MQGRLLLGLEVDPGWHIRYHSMMDMLPAVIVGTFCIAYENISDAIIYRSCDQPIHIIVGPTGFEANETSCQLVKLRRGKVLLASFSCRGAGVEWKEDDEIRITKDGWELKYSIAQGRRSYPLHSDRPIRGAGLNGADGGDRTPAVVRVSKPNIDDMPEMMSMSAPLKAAPH